jgi:hypothetical protein
LNHRSPQARGAGTAGPGRTPCSPARAAFSGVAGQLRYSNYSGKVIIDADLNGDSTADMQILVAGTSFMTGTDFIV